MSNRRKMPVVHIDDNRWYEIAWSGQHEECCVCGTKHVVDHQVRNGKLQMRVNYVEDKS